MRLHRPTVKELREAVVYDPHTGAMTWRVSRTRPHVIAGKPVSISRHGRCTVLNWKWRASTLAWMLHYGHPPRHLIPVDGDPLNLRIKNWRPKVAA